MFLLLAAFILVSSASALHQEPQSDQPVDNNVNTTAQPLISPSCSEGETLGCLKAAMAGLVPALAVPRRLEVWPGLAVVAGGFEVDPPPETGSKMDGYLARGLRAFIASLSLHVRVVDSQVGKRLTKFSRMFSEHEAEEKIADAGRKKKANNALLLGALLSGGTLLALGMAAISAMAGKALMMSLLALGMTMMTRSGAAANGGGGGGGGHEKTTYEIIHTVPHHDDYTHRQWADVTHEGYHVVKNH